MALLGPIASHVTVLKPITSHNDPILTLQYMPSPPDFTIRTILDVFSQPQSKLESASSPSHPFVARLHKPPTLEERARRMHTREQRAMLMRLVFSIAAAIPTFIIAVVYMSLVSHTNETRQWFMHPLWTGNTSRMEWALFFLSTPVMFYSAGIFHRRSLKEIWALWKPGSRVPYWKRFTRFGSMNLLVSTGVSVAYFSSIALLALAASQPASDTGEGDTTSYFDSVVFLAMFLLAGECFHITQEEFALLRFAIRTLLGSLQQGPDRRCRDCAWEITPHRGSFGDGHIAFRAPFHFINVERFGESHICVLSYSSWKADPTSRCACVS